MTRKRMSKQDQYDWDELYWYVHNLMGYDENQSLSRNMVLRLKGMLNGKFMANNSVKNSANYSYGVVLNTFKYSLPDIQRALHTIRFKDESHKFNYIMRIVDGNLNTVYMRMKNADAQKQEAKRISGNEVGHKDVEYKPREKQKSRDKFSDLW